MISQNDASSMILEEPMNQMEVFFNKILLNIAKQGEAQSNTLKGLSDGLISRQNANFENLTQQFTAKCSSMDSNLESLQNELRVSNAKLEIAQQTADARMNSMEKLLESLSANRTASVNQSTHLPAPTNPTYAPSVPTKGRVGTGA